MVEIRKERERLLKGIEEEIEKLERKKVKTVDYKNRIEELKKEAKKLKKELQ